MSIIDRIAAWAGTGTDRVSSCEQLRSSGDTEESAANQRNRTVIFCTFACGNPCGSICCLSPGFKKITAGRL